MADSIKGSLLDAMCKMCYNSSMLKQKGVSMKKVTAHQKQHIVNLLSDNIKLLNVQTFDFIAMQIITNGFAKNGNPFALHNLIMARDTDLREANANVLDYLESNNLVPEEFYA